MISVYGADEEQREVKAGQDDYPNLAHALGAAFNQDWVIDFNDPEEALDAAIEWSWGDVPGQSVIADIERLLLDSNGSDDDTVHTLLRIGICIDPRDYGHSPAAWLRRVADLAAHERVEPSLSRTYRSSDRVLRVCGSASAYTELWLVDRDGVLEGSQPIASTTLDGDGRGDLTLHARLTPGCYIRVFDTTNNLDRPKAICVREVREDRD